MNIMQICSGKGVNGAAYSTLLLTRELARRGNRVSMVCRGDSWIAGQLADDPVEVIPSDLRRWPLDEVRRIAEIIREQGTDIVHTHMSSAHSFGVLLRLLHGIPCVATAHCCRIQLHWMFNDHVIAVSEATRRFHVCYNLVRTNRIRTIYNFIDFDRLEEVPRDARARVRAALGAEEGCYLLTAVGSVTPRKGLLHAVRALPHVLEAVSDARLLAVGEPDVDYAACVRAAAQQLGVADRIIWAGQREDVLQLLAASDLLVHSAVEEPLPRAILEAMASGLPVVASEVGGIPECVTHGETGLLVPPADPTALASAVVRLLRDPAAREQFGEAGRRRIRKDFTPEAHATNTEAVFHRVLNRRMLSGRKAA